MIKLYRGEKNETYYKFRTSLRSNLFGKLQKREIPIDEIFRNCFTEYIQTIVKKKKGSQLREPLIIVIPS